MGVKRILNNKWVTYSIIGIITFVVLICVFTPEIIFFKRIANYTFHIMFGLLLLGLIFLALSQKKLVLACFFASGLLSFFLKNSSHYQLQLATDTGLPGISVAIINLADIITSSDSVVLYIQKLHPDVVLFNELTPDWTNYLSESLHQYYPHQVSLTRIDNYGKATFSHFPILKADTLIYKNIPHLYTQILIGPSVHIGVINTYFNPPLVKHMILSYNEQLEFLLDHLPKNSEPFLTGGDFNLPPWSTELRAFKYTSYLHDSRRDITLRSGKGIESFLKVPVQHIFYNDNLECTKFANFYDGSNTKIGIIGQYQVKPKTHGNPD